MDGKRVSVIIPTLESGEYIERSIMSILNQSYEDIEVVIVDDGSEDSTVSIVREIREQNDNVKLVQRESSGIPSARNRGISEATGHYIANQDSDDISHPDRLRVQIREMEKRDLDVIGTGTYDIDDSDRVLFRRNVIESIETTHVRKGCPIINGTALMKKNNLDELNRYNTNFPVAEDKDLWVRMEKKGCNLGNVDKPLYMFRRHGDSAYASNIEKAKTYGIASVLRADDRISEQRLDKNDIKFEELRPEMSDQEVTNYYTEVCQEMVRYGYTKSARKFAFNSLINGRYARSIGIIGLSFMPQSLIDTIIKNYRIRIHNRNIKKKNK